jgi:N-acetylglucosaminyl-diphospho-decaprenol L-rhamnosyltransferase
VAEQTAIDVVIPTWNGAAVLAECLAALEAEATPHTTIVVDNGSGDGTVEMVRERFPHVRLVALAENLGFGAAINRGVATGSGETLVLLNNDANVRRGFLEAISTPLAAAEVGMVAGVLLVPDTDAIDAAGVEIDRGLAGFSFMTSLPVERLADPPPGLLGPSGGAAAFRRSAFEAADGFDEEIFAYSEDVDLALRLHAMGWSCALAPAARADHVGSATLGLRSVEQIAISSWSRGYVMGRWRIGLGWIGTELAVGAIDCLLLRSTAPLGQRIRGLRDGRGLPSRRVPREAISGAMGWWRSLRHRLWVTRAYERRSERVRPNRRR